MTVEANPGSRVNAVAARVRRPRSAVTSGRKLLIGGDPNGAWSRRLQDLVHLHLSDLGGPTVASEAERNLVRRAGVLTLELERLEAKFSATDDPSPDSIDLYQRLTNSLRRVLEVLATGLSRRPRDVTHSLDGYLEGRYGFEDTKNT